MSAIGIVRSLHSRFVAGRRINVLADVIAELLPPGRTLDVGCGDGSIDALIMKKRPDVEIEGVDIMIRPATAINVRQFDGTNLPFEDKSFDAITLIDVLHHIDDCAPLLRECARVAKKVVIKDHFCRNYADFLALKMMDWVGNAPHGVVLPYRYLSPDQWDSLFAEVGLRKVQCMTKVPTLAFPLSIIFGRNLHFIAALSSG